MVILIRLGSLISMWTEEKKQLEKDASQIENLNLIRNYRNQVEKELKNIYCDVLFLVEKHLIPSATTKDSKSSYYKTKADFYRHLAEFSTGKELKEALKNSMASYKLARQLLPSHTAGGFVQELYAHIKQLWE